MVPPPPNKTGASHLKSVICSLSRSGTRRPLPKGVIWPHKRENNSEIRLLLLNPPMNPPTTRWRVLPRVHGNQWKKTPVQHFRITISDMTDNSHFSRWHRWYSYLLCRYWWNTRIFPFTKKSYLLRAQWRYYEDIGMRILVSPILWGYWSFK